jgi:protein phosphatase 2C family protein 2/3
MNKTNSKSEKTIETRKHKKPSSSLPMIHSNSLTKGIQTPITCSSEVFSTYTDSLKLPKLQVSNRQDQALFRSNTLNIPLFPAPTISISNFGKVKGYLACTSAGLKRGKNEDRVKILLNLKKPENFSEKWPRSSYFGLFDGDQGTSCANFLKENLHSYLFQTETFPYYPKKALIKAFGLADQDFLTIAEDLNDFSGSSALTALFLGNRCFLASLGDSLAVLSASHGEKVIQLNTQHSSLNEEEKNRVEIAGGKFFTEYRIENGVRFENGITKVMPGKMTVTRTFGHFYAKSEAFGGNSRVFISTPEVFGFKIQEDYDFLVLLSSGFNQLEASEVVHKVWEGVDQTSGTFEQKLTSAVHSLMRFACSSSCEENLTAVVICFESFVNEKV